jgi:hypothetical protein
MSTDCQLCDGYNKGTLMGIEKVKQAIGTKNVSLITRSFVTIPKLRKLDHSMWLLLPMTIKASSVRCPV